MASITVSGMDGFSQAADNNKASILAVLKECLVADANVLEVGSGSGQHAIHMAAMLPEIRWQPSERDEVLPLLTRNITAFGSANILPPVSLDLSASQWPEGSVDCVYSANVLHIVSSDLGANLIRGGAQTLMAGGLLVFYGPFRYGGRCTTPSNADFDDWLRERDPRSGVRDFEWVCGLAAEAGLKLWDDRAMPANNQMLVFRR